MKNVLFTLVVNHTDISFSTLKYPCYRKAPNETYMPRKEIGYSRSGNHHHTITHQ
jgi:hypothetical protein